MILLRPRTVEIARLPRSERFVAHRAAADEALRVAARAAGAPRLAFPRDESGAPLPEGGWHHSLSHAPGLAAALVAPVPVGVDVEALDRPRLASLFAYLGTEAEGVDPNEGTAAVRLWSAKEAVSKLLGVGVALLPRCNLVDAVGEELLLDVEGRSYRCVQDVRERHVVSVACDAPFEVAWAESEVRA